MYRPSTVFFRRGHRFLNTTTHIRMICTANKTAKIAGEVGLTFGDSQTIISFRPPLMTSSRLARVLPL